MNQIRRWAGEAGRELGIEEGDWTPAHHAFMYIDEDEGRALRIGTEYLSTRYNMDFRGIAEKYLIHGPPERCAEQLGGFVRAGARHFILRPVGAQEEDADQMARLAEDIIPRVRG